VDRKSRSHADIAELRGVERGVAAASHREADVAGGGEGGVGTAANGGPRGAVGALVGGDGAAAADQSHPSVGNGSGAAVAAGGAAARGGAACPAVGVGTGHAHEDRLGVGGQRITDHHADTRGVAGVLQAADPGDDFTVAG